MSNRIVNTHRRPMRAVTPITRVGRSTAGAAIAAGIALTGAQAAVAVENTGNGKANAAAAPTAAEPASVAIPAVKADSSADGVFGAVTDPESIALTPQAPVAPQPAQTEERQSERGQARQSERTQNADNAQTAERTQNTRSTERGASQRDQNSQRQNSSNTQNASSKSSQKQQNSSAPAQRSGNVMGTARSGIGTRYVYGGSTPAGWDCSGFVSWVFAQHGVSLPHSASAIVNSPKVKRISASEARPGDLVYYPGHIGIYAGNGRTIDAGTSAGSTQERNMWSANWSYYRVVG